MTDEHVLLLMESRGYDIYSPAFSCIYNDRVIYGPNYIEGTANLEVSPANESIEITETVANEEPAIAEEMEERPENAEEILPQDLTFNTPYTTPENAFISVEEELDILAQWDAFIEEDIKETTNEVLTEKSTKEEISVKTEEITEVSAELTESTESAELTETTEIVEEPMADLLVTEEAQTLFRAKKPRLPKFKPIAVQDVSNEPVLEKPTAGLADVYIKGGVIIMFLIFVVTLAIGVGVFLLRRYYAKENNEQNQKY